MLARFVFKFLLPLIFIVWAVQDPSSAADAVKAGFSALGAVASSAADLASALMA